MEVCPWSLPTAHVEALLRTRAHHDALVSYFGGAHELAELRELQRAGEGVAPRARVLLLPGMLGSKLGTPRPWPLPAKLGWVGPRVALGALRELSLDGPVRLHEPMGVFEFVYLRCKLHLRAAGFACEFWPFDWRDGVRAIAARLTEHLRGCAQPVSIVGHSMGGLVALAALRDECARARVERCVLVGAPLGGAHAAGPALRGTHGLVDWLHRLDITSSSADLAREVWSSFPGVYDLLPAEVSHEQLVRGGAPSRAGLHASRRACAADVAFAQEVAPLVHAVAGDCLPTPVALRSGRDGAMSLVYSRVGDGTVARESAAPQGLRAAVLAGVSHTELVRAPAALGAIVRGLTVGQSPARGVQQSVRPVAVGAGMSAGVVREPGVTYLLVRGQRTPTHRLLRVSVLPARAGACVPAGGALVSSEQFARVFGPGQRPQDAAALGDWLGEHALPACVRDALHDAPGALVLLCDREASGLPWEAVRVRGKALCAGRVMTRVLECGEEETRRGVRAVGEQRALIVSNPTGDLPGAAREGECVRELLERRGIASVVLREGEATRANVLAALDARPAIVHVAGHAFFDAGRPARSGVRLCDGVLTSEGLLGAAHVPRLVVLNACESARTRAGEAGASGASATRGGQVGFAEALMRGGVQSVVGTWWPVLDSSAMEFAKVLYGVLGRSGLSEAVYAARRALLVDPRPGVAMDGANYVLYGGLSGAWGASAACGEGEGEESEE
jgi:alpha-beta hydrolase superfamily lysophospholipase